MKQEGNLNVPWAICGYSDTDYSGYNNTQKHVTGYIVLINEVIISWH